MLALRGQPVCVLASGDPLLHGVGSLFESQVAAAEVDVLPTASAFSLAAARLLWSLKETVSISLCGRPLDHVRPYLHPGTRMLALTGGASAPRELARLLVGSGFGRSQLTVLEALGGTKARVRTVPADAFDWDDVSALNTVAIEVIGSADARVLPRAPGLAEELFEHDGQITKREIRALTLSALAPLRGERLWDVGAGSGSVAIEWLLGRCLVAGDRRRATSRSGGAHCPQCVELRCSSSRDRARHRPRGTRRLAAAGRGFHRRRRWRARPDRARSRRVAAFGSFGRQRRYLGDRMPHHPMPRARGRLPDATVDHPRESHRSLGGADDGLAPDHADHPMGMGEAVIVAGLGFRKAVSSAQVEQAIESALHISAVDACRLDAIAVPAAKSGEPGPVAVAQSRGIPLRSIEQEALRAADARSVTRSVRALERFGVRCVAEAAALAGAGRSAHLLGPRIIVGPVTCALAAGPAES